MEYNLGYSEAAQQQLLALPRDVSLIILARLKKEAGIDPANHGHILASYPGSKAIKFRVGAYRIIGRLTYDQVIILSISTN